ncbi:MAG TPA: SPFH domain-containing protein [Oligoflexia bacterium]|nr:SPFH domain-containing protein [Oligoflexia bacterium]HMP47918.1 SPFH domain-containing protein [Oligoflexia bacterium]
MKVRLYSFQFLASRFLLTLRSKFHSSDLRIDNPQSGSVLSILLTLVTLIGLCIVLLFFVFGRIVPPNMIGIRQNFFSFGGILKDGYIEKGLEPGLHLKFPGISDILLIPRDFQFVQLDSKDKSGDLNIDYLEIPTADGSKVKTDLTLITRFYSAPGKTDSSGVDWSSTVTSSDSSDVPIVERIKREHGGPKDLINTYGVGTNRQLSTFAGKAEDSLKRWLSALSTIDYYNPSLREKAAFKATETINQFANKEGIELWATLVRRYTYSEQKIDDQIFAKNLQDATERLNSSLSELAAARAKTEEMRAFWDGQKIAVLKEEGSAKVRVLDEEAKRYEAEKIATGDKMIELATASIEHEKNMAFASPGGKTFVARKLVPVVKSLKGGIVGNIDPYNLDDWVNKLSGSVD